jgi:hypothetical protein
MRDPSLPDGSPKAILFVTVARCGTGAHRLRRSGFPGPPTPSLVASFLQGPSTDFADNQVLLQLFALAYNLGNFLRRLALPQSVKHWSLTTLREKLIKIGAKVVAHSRYVIFQMAEVAVPKRLFRATLERIRRLRPPEAVPGRAQGSLIQPNAVGATGPVCSDRP